MTILPSPTPSGEPNLQRKIKIAAAQVKSAFLDKTKTTEIVCHWIRKAGEEGVTVVGFPETFISGYPSWYTQLRMDDPRSHELYKRLFHNAITVPGPETEQIGQACRDAGVYAVVGCSERRPHTTGSMWNTQLFFGPDGRLLLKHQKYVPTVAERLTYAAGTTGVDASIHTDFGGLSALVCGENSNPLAAWHLSVQSPTVHVASWPARFGGGWSMYDCTLNATRGLAYTLKAFVINATAVIGEEIEDPDPEGAAMLVEEKKKGSSTIINPMGQIIAGPMGPEEGLLVAEIDLEETIAAKYTHDFGGHYNRPELFAPLFEQYLPTTPGRS